ncbi:hypothetical protein [Miltoncostaea marina]|uniref:hypothetical protein n=1 Tax=Miltoncostaea marina TaxID=2843215 RepID=UPI001C3E5FD5|nr:hypothetical protein [Miltoncostaea marina]
MSEGTLKSGKWWIGVTAGAVLGLGGIVAVEAATQEASAQSATFRVTPEQLRINQRISQAAVRRSNEGLQLLQPLRKEEKNPNKVLGWRTQDIQDGAVTAAKLTESVREGQPRWAVVAAGGTLQRAKGATTSAAVTGTPGQYDVTFDRDVSACSIQATIADPGTTAPPASGEIVAWRGSSANVVRVQTADSTGALVATLPFHVTVLC